MTTLLQEGVEVLQDLTINVINRVIEHNTLGHELMTTEGVTKEAIEEHHSILLTIIGWLKPAFGIARSFISENHPFLLGILNWIEKIYDATLGKLVSA
jgi:hypothetical protein